MTKGVISRNLSSVLFRYLPGCYVSFDNLIMTVDEVETVPITSVNTNRIFSRIIGLKKMFAEGKGSDLPSTQDDFVFKKPKRVRLKLHPLTMYCGVCKQGYSFSEAEDIAKITKNRFKCVVCNKGKLKQLPFVYVNQYGFVDQIELKRCSKHGLKYMKLHKGAGGSSDIGQWRWVCHYPNCNEKRDLNGFDPATGVSSMYPVPATAGTIFYPHSTNFVNLPDEDRLNNVPNYQELVIGKYLDILGEFKLKELLYDEEKGDDEAAALIERLKQLGAQIPDEIRQKAVSQKSEIKNRVIEYVRSLIGDSELVEDISYSLLEFMSCKEDLGLNQGRPREKNFRSMTQMIESETEISKKRTFEAFRDRIQELGFTEAWLIEDLNIITSVYGYSRKEFDPKKCKLCKFPDVQDDRNNYKTPIYGAVQTTEGILFQVDRNRILNWLYDLKKIDSIPETDQERKEWFLKNIDLSQAHSLNEIEGNSAFKFVYNALHSISHSLLITGSDICGIDKESMGEIIFPNIPAILIYSNNPSEMGAMASLFEGTIIPWLDRTVEHANRCIYDPICINDEKGACLHCSYISEISCIKLNKDLDRKKLIGKYEGGKLIYKGFWHDLLKYR